MARTPDLRSTVADAGWSIRGARRGYKQGHSSTLSGQRDPERAAANAAQVLILLLRFGVTGMG